ncbi:MAG: hypothetical protein CL609_05000 [Anaerolineaceae bacterium]|nr:hypothetical protein [Anaerolineaceae bacterium]
MFDKLYLINDHSKIETTHSESLKYLSGNSELLKRVANYFWAYHHIGSLIPQTVENFGSGHYFPYSESYYELEASYEFALQGFYRHSLIALRLVLELGLLGVYFSVDDIEHIEVRPWITSREPTPRRKEIFKKLLQLPNFQFFDKKFHLQDRVLSTFDKLDGHTHTRGYKFSSTKLLNHANFNRFEPKSLQRYCDLMFSVVNDIIVVSLLKYPLGMQDLPLDEKYGMNGPVGGFLQDYEVGFIKSLLEPNERDVLQELSDNDIKVQQTIDFMNNLPDLTEEQWKAQFEEWNKFMKDHDGSNTNVG